MNQKGGLPIIIALIVLVAVGGYVAVQILNKTGISAVGTLLSNLVGHLEEAMTKEGVPETGGSYNLTGNCILINLEEPCSYIANSELDFFLINEVKYGAGPKPPADQEDDYEKLMFALYDAGIYADIKNFCKDANASREYSWCPTKAFLLKENGDQEENHITVCINGTKAFNIIATRLSGGSEGFTVSLTSLSNNFNSEIVSVQDSEQPEDTTDLDKALLLVSNKDSYAAIDTKNPSNPQAHFFVLGSYESGEYNDVQYYSIVPTFIFSKKIISQIPAYPKGSDCDAASVSFGFGQTMHGLGASFGEFVDGWREGNKAEGSETGQTEPGSKEAGKFNLTVYFSPYKPSACGEIKITNAATSETASGSIAGVEGSGQQGGSTGDSTPAATISGTSGVATTENIKKSSLGPYAVESTGEWISNYAKELYNKVAGSGVPMDIPTEWHRCVFGVLKKDSGTYVVSYDYDGSDTSYAPDQVEIPANGVTMQIALISREYRDIYTKVYIEGFDKALLDAYNDAFYFTFSKDSKDIPLFKKEPAEEVSEGAKKGYYLVGGVGGFDKSVREIKINVDFRQVMGEIADPSKKIELDDMLFLYYWEYAVNKKAVITRAKDIELYPLFLLESPNRKKIAAMLKEQPETGSLSALLNSWCKENNYAQDYALDKFAAETGKLDSGLSKEFWEGTVKPKCGEISEILARGKHLNYSFPQSLSSLNWGGSS